MKAGLPGPLLLRTYIHTDISAAYMFGYDGTYAFSQQDSAVNRVYCFRVFVVIEMWPPRSPELNPSLSLLVRRVKR